MATTTPTEPNAQDPIALPNPPDDALTDDAPVTDPPAADLNSGPAPVTDLPPADIKHPLKYDTRRADIVSQFKRQRGKPVEEGEDGGEGEDSDQIISDGSRWDDEAEDARQAREEQEESVQDFVQEEDGEGEPYEPQVKEEDLVTLKVDGEERQLTLDETRALAQKYLASDDRLDKARGLLKEVQELKQGLTQPPAEPEATEPAEPEPEPEPLLTSEDQEKLAGIVDQIQTGDAEEGRQALADFMELVRQPAAEPPPNVDVSREIARHEVLKDIRSALAGFRTNHPDLASDPVLEKAGSAMVELEMRDEMLQYGIPEEDITPLEGSSGGIAAAYRNLMENGHELRSYDRIFEDAAGKIRDKFNMRRPAGQQQQQGGSRPASDATRERQARKRAAGTQPRAGGPRSSAGGEVTRPKPKSRLEIINEQRKARGYSTAQR